MTIWNAAHTDHLRLSKSDIDGVSVLATEGELDRWTAQSPSWTAAVTEACETTVSTALVLDLQRLYFMDLVGLAALERFARALEERGRSLLLAGVRPRIREFFRNSSMTMSAACLSLEEALVAAAVPKKQLGAAA